MTSQRIYLVYKRVGYKGANESKMYLIVEPLTPIHYCENHGRKHKQLSVCQSYPYYDSYSAYKYQKFYKVHLVSLMTINANQLKPCCYTSTTKIEPNINSVAEPNQKEEKLSLPRLQSLHPSSWNLWLGFILGLL